MCFSKKKLFIYISYIPKKCAPLIIFKTERKRSLEMCTKCYERLSDDRFTNTVSKNLYMIFNTYVRLTGLRTVFPLLMLPSIAFEHFICKANMKFSLFLLSTS